MRRQETMGDLIAESLIAYGVKPEASAVELVRRARPRPALPEARALRLPLAEAAAVRSERAATARRVSRRTR